MLSVYDNAIDALLQDQGVARRLRFAAADKAPRTLAAATLADGVTADSPLAEPGSPH